MIMSNSLNKFHYHKMVKRIAIP